jgi:hypothetical protein
MTIFEILLYYETAEAVGVKRGREHPGNVTAQGG